MHYGGSLLPDARAHNWREIRFDIPRVYNSITNEEYKSAVKGKIPIFALVERSVLDDYRVYRANSQNTAVNANAIRYPAADSTKIFDFIDQVQAQVVNNALVPFSDFEEMQAYLRQQWASMLHRYLTNEGEARRTADILEALAKANERIEFLTRRVVESVASPLTKATVELYDILLQAKVTHSLQMWGLSMSPKSILSKATIDEFCHNKIKIEDEDKGLTITGGGPPYMLSKGQYDADSKAYITLRKRLEAALKAKGIALADYLGSQEP